MPESGYRRGRVFFALWPDAPALERLDLAGKQLHTQYGGRRMRRETIHLTLAFIGAVPPERIDALRQAAGRVEGKAFTLCLDRFDCWRHNRIAWAGCSEPPLYLLTLVGQLAEHLAEVGLPLETRDFAAHVTLLRDVYAARCTPIPEFEPISWPVSEFVLVESNQTSAGPHYDILDRWPLDSALARQ